MSEIKKIFEKKTYRLPISNSHSKSLSEILFDNQIGILHIYREDILKLNCIVEEDKKRILTLCDILEKVLEYYNQGRFDSAFKVFDEYIKNIDFFKYVPIITIQEELFFRIRTQDTKIKNTDALKRQELFHIPFDKRRIISTQRFSVPGFPCLYAGNSLYVCWKELDQPKLENTFITRLNVSENSSIKVYDLSFERYNNWNINDDTDLRYLYLYPLITACSISVPDNCRDNVFKPEYIVPQLIFQIIINKIYNGIEQLGSNATSLYFSDIPSGIIYSSTRIKEECQGEFRSIVLSPHDGSSLTSGYSKLLSRKLKMTDVIEGWITDYDIQTSKSGRLENPNATRVKIGGKLHDYQDTKFAALETILKNMEAEDINFNSVNLQI